VAMIRNLLKLVVNVVLGMFGVLNLECIKLGGYNITVLEFAMRDVI